jgi:hypothetical protein
MTGSASVTETGVRVPSRVTAPIDVFIDDVRVWSFQAGRDDAAVRQPTADPRGERRAAGRHVPRRATGVEPVPVLVQGLGTHGSS